MKKIVTMTIAVIAIIGSMVVGCNKTPEKVLYLYNWSDYISPEVVAKFEEKYECRVILNTFEDNETMLAKMLVGSGGYDVIIPSSYVIPVMRRKGLIQKLDMSKLPNVMNNLDKKYSKFLHEDSLVYSVPYAFSITGIAYRKDKVAAESLKSSWEDLKNPSFGGRVCMLRDMREVLGVGLLMKGHSINTVDGRKLNGACNYALELKKYITCLDNEAYKGGLVSGEFLAAMGYNSDVLQIMDENENIPIEFMIPKEGTTCCWDEMVIPNGCKNQELAYQFINFLYDGEVAAANLAYVCSAIPNKAMLQYVDEESKNNPWINPTEEMLNKGELIKDVGDDVIKFQKQWDRFLSTRVKE